MKLFTDTSDMCCECTGAGCKVCNGTGHYSQDVYRGELLQKCLMIAAEKDPKKIDDFAYYTLFQDRLGVLGKLSNDELIKIIHEYESNPRRAGAPGAAAEK